MIFNPAQAISLARQTFEIEAAAVWGLREKIGSSFSDAVSVLLSCSGRVVVMGMGKSGHIGRKISATLSSTGTPSFFVHPAEAGHGDLGMITASDVVVVISNSGEVVELSAVLPVVKRLGAPLIAITGNSDSTLASHADIVLNSAVEKEACPLNLAPTASTMAQMAMGDALAVALLDARGFKAEDFARSHPDGALGRKLLTHVTDVMRKGSAVPQVSADARFTDMMREVSAKGVGACAIVDRLERVVGIFTDGDLRRLIENGVDLRAVSAAEVMHRMPKSIRSTALAVDAAELMEIHQITSVLVVGNEGVLEGIIHVGDLLRAKVI